MLSNNSNTKIISNFHLAWRHKELLFWVAALIMLYTANPNTDFTLCVLKNIGVENCPGCGIGHAITAAMHGNFSQSWEYHYFGIAAFFIIVFHIIKLIKNLIIEILKPQYYERKLF